MIDITILKNRVAGGFPHGVVAEVNKRSGCSSAALYALLKRYDGQIDETALTEKEQKMFSGLIGVLDDRDRNIEIIRESCAPRN